MYYLPEHPNLDHLREQAKFLLRSAKAEDPDAVQRLEAVGTRRTLSTAQLAVAREYGFPSWPAMKLSIDRRAAIDTVDLTGLRRMLVAHLELASAPLERFCDHRGGADPLNFVAMARYDTAGKVWRDVPGAAELAQALIDAGADPNGRPGEDETPLMTVASYGDPQVARVLLAAGADIDARAGADAGGVPKGTALQHAAAFGMTDVVDLLAAAGATVTGLVDAAAVGTITDHLTPTTPGTVKVAALRMAAAHDRLAIIDQLLDAGTPVDGLDEDGSSALHEAAYYGQLDAARRLIDRGADVNLKDRRFDSTPLGWCQHQHEEAGHSPAHEALEAYLTSVAG